MALFGRALLTWILFIPIAIGNAILRNSVYKKYTGELLAHQISTVIAVFLFILLAYFLLKSEIPKASWIALLFIGVLFVVLTVAFEFGFGHYVIHTPWSILLADYNLFAGRIWVWFLFTELLTPFLFKVFISSQ